MRLDTKLSFLVLSSFPLVLAGAGKAEALKIADQGAARAVIVVSTGAAEPEKHAAGELAGFLNKVTGAQFPVTAAHPEGRPRLLVGPDAARLADPAFSIDGLGAEGLVIRTTGDDLILAGGRPRGTLYAVYTFLEDQVGCRWWSPAVSHIPSKPTLEVGPLNLRCVPKLEYREPFWFSAFDADWAARNKCNGYAFPLDEKRGGKHVMEGFVHTFYTLIPPGKYFQDHPEWFSEVDGRRTHDRAQLCLSNEQMRRELIKNLKQRLRRNPAATMASVSQNDCHGHCQCARCSAIDKEEGSPAGSMIRFVNAVAADIEKEFPDLAVSTLAYTYTRKPPAHARPRPNVVVWLCSIECGFAKPLTHQRNARFRTDMEGWSKICKRLYVWDYTTNFAHYILPHPNLRVLGPNVRFFVDHNVKGLFEQGAYQSPGAEMMELRAWVLAKLLWDPSLDAQKLIDEFLDGYYGPAATHVRAYLELLHDAVDASGDTLGCGSPADAKFLSIQTLSKGWAHLQAAQRAAGADPDLSHRLQVARMPLLYAFVVQWDRLRDEARTSSIDWPVSDSAEAVYQQFMETARAIKVTRASERHEIGWLKTQVKPGR